MIFYLYRYVDGEFVLWGKFVSPQALAEASFELGKLGVEQIKIEEHCVYE